jgi:hypothetical protein
MNFNVTKRIYAILICLLVSCIFTGQTCYGNRLVVGKDTLCLMSQPIKSEFIARKITMEELWGVELAKRLGCFDDNSYMSCYATWKLEKNRLYLEEITPSCGDFNSAPGQIPKVDLKKLFPNQFRHGHVFAEWVTEEIVVAKGKCLFSTIDFLNIYARETGFIFKNGVLQNTVEYDNSKTKLSPYMENQLMLRDFIQSNIRWNEIKSEIDSTRKVVYCRIVSTNESGRIDSVQVVRGQSEILNREAVRVIKAIPQWEVLFKNGKQIHRSWTLPIRFDLQTMHKSSP